MDSDVQIRLAGPQDVETIAELNLAMALETEHLQLNRSTVLEGVRTVLAHPEYGFYVVAEGAGEVVGCLLITFEWSDWRCGMFWWVQSLYVRPPYRRRGVFGRLHEFVRTEALQHPEVCGIRLYVEQSNQVAQHAYHQRGMHARSYRMYEQMLR